MCYVKLKGAFTFKTSSFSKVESFVGMFYRLMVFTNILYVKNACKMYSMIVKNYIILYFCTVFQFSKINLWYIK